MLLKKLLLIQKNTYKRCILPFAFPYFLITNRNSVYFFLILFFIELCCFFLFMLYILFLSFILRSLQFNQIYLILRFLLSFIFQKCSIYYLLFEILNLFQFQILLQLLFQFHFKFHFEFYFKFHYKFHFKFSSKFKFDLKFYSKFKFYFDRQDKNSHPKLIRRGIGRSPLQNRNLILSFW